MKKILLRAPLLTQSGYGEHSRQVFQYLDENGYDFDVQALRWGATSWLINPDYLGGMIGRIMQKTIDPKGDYDVSIQIQLPDEWDKTLGKFNIGVTAGIECHRCNPAWIEKVNEMDLVIVPSEFTKKVFENTGKCKTEIKVIHEYFKEKSTIKTELTKKLDKLMTPTNFLFIGTVTGADEKSDRKNFYNLIKWFFEEFENNPDTGLVLKVCCGKGTRIDKAITRKRINSVIESFRKSDFPKVHLIHGNLTNEEMSEIYSHPKVTCLVAPTRGEGYGLPFIEAGSHGLPVISTNWSGHKDFLRKSNLLCDYYLKEIPDSRIDNRIFTKGLKWAEIEQNDLKRKMRKIYEGEFKENTAEVNEDINKNFNKSKAFEKYKEAFRCLQ